MRKLILFIAFSFLSILSYSQWNSTLVDKDSIPGVASIEFSSNNVGMVAGYNRIGPNYEAIISLTTNSGQNWNVVDSSRSGRYLNIESVNSTCYYASGVRGRRTGIVSYTTNLGSNWTYLTVNFPIYSMSYTGDSLIYLMSDSSLYSLKLNSSQVVYRGLLPSIDSIYNDLKIQFINDSTGFFSHKGNLFFTDDFGNNWTVKYSDSSLFIGDFQVLPRDSLIFLLSFVNRQLSANSKLVRSEDLGNSWLIVDSTSASIPGSSLEFVNKDNGYIASYIKVLKSNNRGVDWDTYPLRQLLPPFMQSHYIIDCPSVDTCYASGAYILAKTYNGGGPLSTGINQIKRLNELKLYPNPTESSIRVSGNSPINTYQLLDLNGRLVSEGSPNSTDFVIDLNDYKAGIYLLRAEQAGKWSSLKVIKR